MELINTIDSSLHSTTEIIDLKTSIPATANSTPEIRKILSTFKNADGLPKYEMMGKKPVLYRESKSVLTVTSDAFGDKLLCDGLTLNTGDTCVYSCTFCYAPKMVLKLNAGLLDEFNQETGLRLRLEDVVIRRHSSLKLLEKQLLREDRIRIHNAPNDHRVVYSSTLVDVAANMEILKETAATCKMILENTEWQIRLLSKSPLLKLLITKELIPKKYHHRLILGFSTGTLDDRLAAAIEMGTGTVSKRIEALHELQDLGIRTFGMICPSLPYGTQEEYDAFSREICEAIRVDRCEHVWAEVINVRGNSLVATATGLRSAGYDAVAQRLEAVSGPGAKSRWEDYSRMTFEAHKKHVPADKLRYLQYIDEENASYWSDERRNGAVLLGKHAEKHQLVTIGSSSPTVPFPPLDETDIAFHDERRRIVTRGVSSIIAAAEALHQIHTYKNGILWRTSHRTFDKYCQENWGYQKTHAYRLVRTGELVTRLADCGSPFGENSKISESHLRPVLNVPEDLQVECWKNVSADLENGSRVTASRVATSVKKFLGEKGVVAKPAKRSKPDIRDQVRRLEANLAKFVPPERLRQLLDPIRQLVEPNVSGPIEVPTTISG